jgi:predicted ArsR family transcriptional regulator
MKKADFNLNIEKVEQVFYHNLTEKDRRLFVGLEAMKIGYYGVQDVANKYKINKHTVRKGQKELLSEDFISADRIRKKGGGRKKK